MTLEQLGHEYGMATDLALDHPIQKLLGHATEMQRLLDEAYEKLLRAHTANVTEAEQQKRST